MYVTHDQQDAFALADRIALMQGSRIVQIGGPTEIYNEPASASIAHFLGVSNIFPCIASQNVDGIVTAVCAGGVVVCTTQRELAASDDLKVCTVRCRTPPHRVAYRAVTSERPVTGTGHQPAQHR